MILYKTIGDLGIILYAISRRAIALTGDRLAGCFYMFFSMFSPLGGDFAFEYGADQVVYSLGNVLPEIAPTSFTAYEPMALEACLYKHI